MRTVILFFALIFSSIFYAQTADEIIEKHFENNGGISAWDKLNSIIIDGQVTIGLGETYPIRIYHQRPYYKKVVFMEDGKEKLSEGFDGKKAFTLNSAGQLIPLNNYIPDAFETDILNYRKKGFKAELVGSEIVNNQDCFKIKLTKNKSESIYWFRKTDFQLIKEKNSEEETNYADFKDFKGLTFATRMESTPHGGEEYVVEFTSVKPNASIESSVFVFE